MEKKKFEPIQNEIINERNALLSNLKEETVINGSYESWYDDLEDFRNSLGRFYSYQMGKELYRLDEPEVVLPTGDSIDHHIIGYLAPLEFKRIGWGGEKYYPYQQLTMLDRFFKAHNTRFIYAALPCKGAVYPQLIASEETLKGKTTVIPQWRKMLKELAENEVEVVDLLPVMQKEGEGIFQKTHYISCKGAGIIAKELNRYIRRTSHISDKEDERFLKPDACERKDLAVFDHKDEFEAGIFGNCNLQAHLQEGDGILFRLINEMKFPVSYEGRHLPFCCTDPVTTEALKRLTAKELVIYVGFPSGSFVRTSAFWNRDSSENNPWSTVSLEL